MFIQTESTPNPATLKFIPGKPVMGEGTVDIPDRAEAARSPLAQRLFGIDGVSAVFLGPDFITVTKSAGEWPHLKPQILGAIMEHYQSGQAVFAEGTARLDHADHEGADEEEAEIIAQIKDLLDTRVRPAVAQDGGDIVFHGYANGVVFLHMRGSCSGCPSSALTLKNGIENLLRHYVPEVTEVRPV